MASPKDSPPARRWQKQASAAAVRWLLPALLVATTLIIQSTDPQFRARIRDSAFDQLQSLAPRAYVDALPIRVIAIDDASLARVGQWPWSRTVMAEIVDRLVDMGAAVVALDIVLAEPDRTSPEQAAARWADNLPLRDLLLKMPSHDEVLAQSFSRGKVVLGFPIEPVASGLPLPPDEAHFLSFGGNAIDWLPPYPGGLASLPALTAAATGSGAISLSPSGDGVLRAMPLVYRVQDTLYPGFGLEALRLFANQPNISIQVTDPAAASRGQMPGIQDIGLGNAAFLPTAPDGRVWLHFRPLAAQRYVSAADLLAGKADPQALKNSIVFVGATAKGLGDNVYTPLGELVPGIEGHVQLVEQMLEGDYLLRPAWENELVAALMVAAWLLLAYLLARFRPIWAVLLSVLVVASLFGLSGWLFVAQRLLFDPVFPSLAVGALFIALVVPRYLRTERDQRWIRDAFARYVSPNRVKYLQENPQDLELGSIYRECSFVMTDLEGFTPLMEKYQPDLLADLLNDYLDKMIRIAFSHDGTIDRIVGDAVVVMFSAPAMQPDHAARALACALEMDAFASECSRQHIREGISFGRTRIGVNTGTVLIGNFGGGAMLDYRALGDAINTAARLETINGQIGTNICVSGTTVAQCPEFVGRPVGQLVLKGKTQEIMVYQPLTPDQAAAANVVAYRAAYRLLDTANPQANAVFQSLAGKYPDDPLIAYHANRLAQGESGSRVVMKSK
ncbi:MAG: adenylate/guanylate cyclase domain-containing protein [Sulfuricella sp.]|nr:adenylate/guanylate cyclase domain-containing protein [Sulfuricella sp.]